MTISIPTSIAGVNLPGLSGPLARLNQNDTNAVNYTYPLDLGTGFHKHWIRFSIKNINRQALLAKSTVDGAKLKAEFDKYAATALEKLKHPIDTVVQGGSAAVSAIKDFSMKEAATALEDNLKTGAQQMGSILNYVSGNPLTDETNMEYKGSVGLYMPENLTFVHKQVYEDAGLVAGLGKPYTYAQLGAAIIDHVHLKDGAQGLLNNATTTPEVRQALALLIGDKFGMPDAEKHSLKSIGYATNPQMQVLFKETEFRTFTFEFTLTPKSAKEANQIASIIQLFKVWSAPELSAGGLGVSGMYFHLPAAWDIEFFNGETVNGHIPRIGRCVLESISVNYGQNGWAAYVDGRPVQTHIELQFKEIQIVHRDMHVVPEKRSTFTGPKSNDVVIEGGADSGRGLF